MPNTVLTAEELEVARTAAVEARLFELEVHHALLGDLPPAFVAAIPDQVSPATRLTHTLDLLNRTPVLGDGITQPLHSWLRRAAERLSPRPESLTFERLARICADRLDEMAADQIESWPTPSEPEDPAERLRQHIAEMAASGAPEVGLRSARERLLDLERQGRDGEPIRSGNVLGDRFLLVDKIDEGGYGEVWRAWDQRAGGDVAIKVLHHRFMRAPVERGRFLRGARQMHRLGDPGVVQVIEPHCQHGGRLYFVMEFVPGGDLRRAVLGRQVSPKAGLDLVLGAAEALGRLHGRGLVHRDIKPSNILLGADGRPLIADFDLVLAPTSTGGTRGGLGTAHFVAPEQAQNAAAATSASDVYSLGKALMFVGLGRALGEADARMHDEVLAGLPFSTPVRGVIARATAVAPGERYRDGVEFGSALALALRAPEPPDDSEPPEEQPRPSDPDPPDEPDPSGPTPPGEPDPPVDDIVRWHALRAEHADAEYVAQGLGILCLIWGIIGIVRLTGGDSGGDPDPFLLTLSILATLSGFGLFYLSGIAALAVAGICVAVLPTWPATVLGIAGLVIVAGALPALNAEYREATRYTEMPDDVEGPAVSLVSTFVIASLFVVVGYIYQSCTGS